MSRVELTIESLIETNRRLNRRCQELESIIGQCKSFNHGYDVGMKVSNEINDKECEKRLAEYKVATRKAMRDARQLTATKVIEWLKQEREWLDDQIGSIDIDRNERRFVSDRIDRALIHLKRLEAIGR